MSWALLSCLFFVRPVSSLVQLARHDDSASHILLIPFIAAWLLYSQRREPSLVNGYALWPAMTFVAPATFAVLLSEYCASCSPKDRLSILILALIFFLVAGFVLIFGTLKAKSSSFALAFLLFAIPIPDALLNRIVYWLQSGSAAIAELIFDVSGAPALRQGFVFHLPKLSIEVAQECSGIRSSLALLILALLVGHFSFGPLWKKIVFAVAGFFMMLVKNGIRIATLTLLANYVNPNFLYGRLHHEGGVVFFLVGLGFLWPVYRWLRRGEPSTASPRATTAIA
jgi:exosortase